MPQMMPIWWSMIFIMALLFFMCINSVLYFFPLFQLQVEMIQANHASSKLIDMSKYDL